MSWLNIIGIAIGLAMDAFAVAIGAGLTIPRLTGRHVFRLAWHFGFFQFLMPILGWLAGRTLAGWIDRYDHWVAFGLLWAIGGKMIYEAVRGLPDERQRTDPTRGTMLVMLSVATSLDALAVGLTMAFLSVSIWLPAVVIGLVAGGLTFVGIRIGARLGAKLGHRMEHWAEAVGGIVLLAIGARILIGSLMG